MDLYTAIVFAVFASLFLVCLLPSRPFHTRKSAVDELTDDTEDPGGRNGFDSSEDNLLFRQSRSLAENAQSESRNYGPVMDLAE